MKRLGDIDANALVGALTVAAKRYVAEAEQVLARLGSESDYAIAVTAGQILIELATAIHTASEKEPTS
jgi:hypothetical protein